jgi:conjugal transfer/type IV secretion protein DotA/TraY
MTTNAIFSSSTTSDKSVGFFNDIFGQGWENILDSGSTSTGGAGATIEQLFLNFSAVVLFATTIFVLFIVMTGVVGTAHEGEALGKRYSTLWVPIRAAFGISLLAPLPWAKYSLLQALILKFIYISILGANFLAVNTVDFMASRSGAVSTPRAKLPYVEGIGEEILKNLTVQEYFKEREGLAADGIYAKNTTGIKSFTFIPPAGTSGAAMGRFKISCIDGVQSADLCDSELNASVALVSELRPVAKAVVSQWSRGANIPLDEAQIQAYRTALNNYVRASQQAETAALAAVGTNQELDAFKQAARNNGWTWLGVYYWKIAKFNELAEAKTQVKLLISSPLNEDAIANIAGPEIMSVLDRYYTFVETIAAGRVEQRTLANVSGDGVGMGSLLGSFFTDAIGSSFGDNTAMTGGARLVAETLSNGDPISNLQKFGHSLINSGSMIGTVGAAGSVIGKAISVVDNGASPLKVKVVPKGVSVAGKIAEKLGGMLMVLAGALIAAGVFLAYYLPALPFIIWTSAIVGWLILSVELLVAAPIWAAMHVIPEGEGVVGQRAEAGYMLFFGILMRPALYVIGFFLSFVIAGVVGHFIGEAYLDFTVSAGNDDLPVGPVSQIVGWLATVIIGGGLAVVSIHKTFSIVTYLPDEIMRRLGATPSMSTEAGEQKSEQSFGAAMKVATGPSTKLVNAGLSSVSKPKVFDSNTLRQGDK